MEGCIIDDLDGAEDSLKGYRSLTHGDYPDVLKSESLASDVEQILSILDQLTADGVGNERVCITARMKKDLQSYESALKQKNRRCLMLQRDTPDDPSVPGVRLATMHRIKGLEFEVVILAGYEGVNAYADKFSHDEDAGVSQENETAERCLLHVAATRAKRHLFCLMRS